jgi:hypothetical protein
MELAGVTGLEPATSGVTGQRSNQLSYTPEPGARGTPASAGYGSAEIKSTNVRRDRKAGVAVTHDRAAVVGGERLELPTSTV